MGSNHRPADYESAFTFRIVRNAWNVLGSGCRWLRIIASERNPAATGLVPPLRSAAGLLTPLARLAIGATCGKLGIDGRAREHPRLTVLSAPTTVPVWDA